MKNLTKKEMKKKSVSECLTLFYNNQVNENAIREKSKEDLADFVLEVFNKGIIRNYLNL